VAERRRFNSPGTMKEAHENGPPKRCVNCNTERYGVYRKGYCKRCYPLVLKKEQAKQWDAKDPSILDGLWKGGRMSWKDGRKLADGDDPDLIRGHGKRSLERELPICRRNRLKQIDLRLVLLKDRELQRNSEVDGSQIEAALQRLAEWSGGKKNRLLDIAEKVNDKFDQEQRRLLPLALRHRRKQAMGS
jgi:hypothetical protein